MDDVQAHRMRKSIRDALVHAEDQLAQLLRILEEDGEWDAMMRLMEVQDCLLAAQDRLGMR